MPNAFRFVLVGSGNMSRTYVRAVENIPNAGIVGVVSRSGSVPECMDPGRVEVADSISGISAEFDAVIVTTPNGLHHGPTIEAAALGKHVLTEKPLDVTIEAMDAMVAACRENSVKLGVAYQKHACPDNLAVKELLDRKQLGRVYAADVYVKYYREQSYYTLSDYRGTKAMDGGGPFMHQGSHDIDLYCWFFGKPVKVVSMLDTFAHDIEVEDHGVAILRHEDGMIGSITASTITKPGFSARMEIHAEAGTVVLKNEVIDTWEVEGIENPTHSEGIKIHDGSTSMSVEETYGHEVIIKDFIEAVQQDREPMVSADLARMATEVVLQIYENAV